MVIHTLAFSRRRGAKRRGTQAIEARLRRSAARRGWVSCVDDCLLRHLTHKGILIPALITSGLECYVPFRQRFLWVFKVKASELDY